jgi:hypothetical protein
MIDESAFSDYHKFEYEIKHKNRFFVDPKFIESIRSALKLNISVKIKGSVFYRARIHNYEDNKNIPFSTDEMFNPEPEKAVRGRANPDGISYLYLSSDMNTCIKEVLPKHKDILTICEFSLRKNVNLISFIYSFPISENNYTTSLNHCIRLTFSESQLSLRPEIDYLPYQFICELIKNENYDGVLYYSCYDKDILTNSYNIVLFDPTHAVLNNSKCSLIKIISTDYEYEEVIKDNTV